MAHAKSGSNGATRGMKCMGSCDLFGGRIKKVHRHNNCNRSRKTLSSDTKEQLMRANINQRAGKIKYGLAAWMLGLPLPIIIIALFFRGCDW
jgi:hypothetical protein